MMKYVVVALLAFSSSAIADEDDEAAKNKSSTIVYHRDADRTGWVRDERVLTPAKVKAGFGLVAHARLDDQVDAEPLVANGVVYVVTESNTVYAIDANTGAILSHRNLGAAVPKPLGCSNNGPNVGINGTPAIDLKSQTLYVMAYVNPKAPEYHLHALALATLADKKVVTVKASHKLADGTLFSFNAKYQRQRPGLLLSHGNVYAAFGSFCDFQPENSRGWLLGWNAESLAPLAHNELVDSNAIDTTHQFKGHSSYFLASVWMSGYGPAADAEGNLYFVTGNGNGDKGVWHAPACIQETVAKVSHDLNTLVDYFTPDTAPNDQVALDDRDADYGSGGVMLVPGTDLAVAAGKTGQLFILDRKNMGHKKSPDVPAFVDVGACWCGPSYFEGADNRGRVVTSGGDAVKTWIVDTARRPALTLEATAPALKPATAQDGGFFTTVSSWETKPNTQIIWAIGRPSYAPLDPKNPKGKKDDRVRLYAFDGTAKAGALSQLWSGVAGHWPNRGGNANLVPTVANGKVYVASNMQLAIFGPTTPSAKALDEDVLFAAVLPGEPIEGALFWGTVVELQNESMTIKLRDGKTLTVDTKPARAAGTGYDAHVGDHVAAQGKKDASGVLHAHHVYRAKQPAAWGEDKPE